MKYVSLKQNTSRGEDVIQSKLWLLIFFTLHAMMLTQRSCTSVFKCTQGQGPLISLTHECGLFLFVLAAFLGFQGCCATRPLSHPSITPYTYQ